MYYIINANNQIIAADQLFLDRLGIENITQIYHKLEQGDISLEYKNDILKFTDISVSKEYKIVKTPLSSLLGDLYVIEFEEEYLKESNQTEEVSTGETDDILHDIFEDDNLHIIEEESITLDSEEKEQTIEIEDTQEDILLEEDNFLLEDGDSDHIEENKDEASTSSDDEIFDLLLTSDDNAPLISLDADNANKEMPEKSEQEPIVLDIEALSQTIGISEEDYQSFLNEYKETAMNLKQDLINSDIDKRNSAIQTLQHLSSVLHIPLISELLDKVATDFSDELVDELYITINRITTDKDSHITISTDIEETSDESKIELKSPMPEEELKPQEQKSTSTAHKIDLSNVKPIHFDFSMEQAANELSLPVDLIDEFVHDFIEQAHEETENMLTAYDEGDLDRVNKLGHLLKGTSSNLRITPLADTLYKIQFCESLDELEPLIKDYWGHFLAFEKHIKMRTN